MTRKPQAGFTLIELVITVAIVAILAAVAYPSYQNYLMRGRRTDGKEIMQRIAAAEERFYTNRNRYTDDPPPDSAWDRATPNKGTTR